MGSEIAKVRRRLRLVWRWLFVSPCQWCGEWRWPCDCEERIACQQAGAIGHMACGWCVAHRGPRFKCLCRCRSVVSRHA